ncbi:hypothetical protein HYS10_01880 [Candidatus Collierbacteria bacterium]|nr:hypothetical protein [Candidatus Collierbacteria bacterium]
MIAIATSITAAGIVGLSRLQTIFKLRPAADEVRSQLQLGRELAIANKDQVNYQINLASGILILRGGVTEIARFQTPAGVNYAPSTLTWGFTPLTGSLTGCSLPCQLTLSSGDESEIVTIQANGIIN